MPKKKSLVLLPKKRIFNPKKICKNKESSFESSDPNLSSENESHESDASNFSDSETPIESLPKASNKSVLSSIRVSKITEDHNWVLVFWIDEKKFSVEPYLCVHLKNGEKLKTGEQHEISYGKETYLGLIKFIGSKEKCNEILKTVSKTGKNKDESLNPTQNSELKKNVKHNEINHQKKIKEQELEILKYKTKLIQLHKELDDEKTKNSELTKNIVDLKEILSKHEKTFDREEINRILTMCKIFENLFSFKNNTYIPTMVSFSKEFPNFLIPSDQETKIRGLISETAHLNGQKAFREIVSVLIDKTDFLSKSASQLIKEYPHFINPLEELLRRNDKSFSICKRNLALNSLVHDTRKSQKKLLSKVEKSDEQLIDSDFRDN